MKRLMPIAVIIIVLIAGATTYFGARVFANHYLDKPAVNSVVACSKRGQSHTVSIQNGAARPANTNAKLCDTLTIKNTDGQIRLMAFGEHENHQPYDGITERVLDKNQSFTVTLNQAGSFKFHDHLDDSAQGAFTVH